MPRAGAGHSHSRRAAPTARFETLLDKVDEVLQGQQAIIERLDRMEGLEGSSKTLSELREAALNWIEHHSDRKLKSRELLEVAD